MESKYQVAWLIFFVAVVAAHLLVWQLIRRWRSREGKQVILLCLFAFLATPVPLEPGSSAWVPSFMAALMEAIDGGIDAALNRLWPALVVMLCLVLGSIGGRWYLQNRRHRAQSGAG